MIVRFDGMLTVCEWNRTDPALGPLLRTRTMFGVITRPRSTELTLMSDDKVSTFPFPLSTSLVNDVKERKSESQMR